MLIAKKGRRERELTADIETEEEEGNEREICLEQRGRWYDPLYIHQPSNRIFMSDQTIKRKLKKKDKTLYTNRTSKKN